MNLKNIEKRLVTVNSIWKTVVVFDYQYTSVVIKNILIRIQSGYLPFMNGNRNFNILLASSLLTKIFDNVKSIQILVVHYYVKKSLNLNFR